MRSNSPRTYSSNTSRTPTPSPTPTSKFNNKKFYNSIDSFFYEISNDKVLFPIIIILSIILSIIALNMAPSYCSADGSQTSFRCKRCPDNSKCSAISFQCEQNYTKINNNCVSEEQKDYYTQEVSDLATKISQHLDKSETIINLDELSNALNESPLPIRRAIEFTDYRIISDKNETIEKVYSSPSTCGYWIFITISYIITLFGLITLAYHFLRYKKI